jgi:hypothetical protein
MMQDIDEAHERALAAAEQECHYKEHARKAVQRYLSEMYLADFVMERKQTIPDPFASASNNGVIRTVAEYIRSRRG